MIPTCYNQSFNCGRYDTKYMAKAANVKEWDLLWQEYTKSLENWKKMFEQAQEANNEMQARFNDVWEKATVDTSADTMKRFAENWQKAMNNAGIWSFKEFSEGWQKALNDAGSGGFAQFAENWQKALNATGLDQMNAYGEMVKKFGETWNRMWPKS